jgi:hypothetical protein
MFSHKLNVSVLAFVLAVVAGCGWAQNAQAQELTIPAGTKISTLKYSDGSVVNLKPAEQVAWLVVYTVKDLESTCASTFFGGPGRPCLWSELRTGITTKNGQPVGLTINPADDTKYRYLLQIIGQSCIFTAIPKVPGLGAFAWVGDPANMSGNGFYYNPDGADLMKAKTLGDMGYEGNGFKKQ